MNKKMLIGLSVAGLALVGIAATVTGVILTQSGKTSLEIASTTETEAVLKLKGISEHKGKTLQVYVKTSTEKDYPTTAKTTLVINAEGSDAELKLTDLVANTTYSVKITTTAATGSEAIEVAKVDSLKTKAKTDALKSTLNVTTTRQTEAVLKLSKISEHKGKTLQVYVKASTETDYPTTAKTTLVINAAGADTELNLTGLTANTTYSVKITTTAATGSEATEVAKLETFKTEAEVTPTPIKEVTALVVERSTTTAKIEFDSLDKFVDRELVVKAQDSSSASATVIHSNKVNVTETKKALFELNGLSSDTQYKYTLVANAVAASNGVEAKEEVEVYKSTTATEFRTHGNPTLNSTLSATGIAVQVTGLQDYEGKSLVITLYKKVATPAASASASSPATLSSTDAPTSTADSTTEKGGIISILGVVKDNTLKLEFLGIDSSSSYEIVVTTDKTARNVILKQEVTTLSTITVEAGTKGPESLGITLKTLDVYKGKTLLVKYALVENSQTDAEALEGSGSKTKEVEIPAALAGSELTTFIEALMSGKKYAAQVYLKDVPNAPLLDTPFTETTTAYATLEASTTTNANPKLYKGGIEIKFDELLPWKDKKIDIHIVPEELDFSTTTASDKYKRITSTAAVSDTKKITFNITGLLSETKYKYKITVENEMQNLLASVGSFTSAKTAKAAEATLKTLTNEKAEIELSKLDDYVGKKLKLQYKDSTESVTVWSDLTPSQTVTLENKDSILFALTKTELTDATKSYQYKVVEDPTTSDEIVSPQELLLKLPEVTHSSTTSKFTVNLQSLDTLVGKTIVLQYKKSSASEWITGEEKEIESSNKDALSFSSPNTLDSEKVYDYKILIKDSYTIVVSTVVTLATPVVGTKGVTSTSIKFTIQNLSDYVGREVVLKYREKNAATWSTDTTKITVTDANKTTEQFIVVSSLSANTEYEYYFTINKKTGDANAVDTPLQKQSIVTSPVV